MSDCISSVPSQAPMFNSLAASATSTHENILLEHARKANEETIVRLGHEVASLRTTLEANAIASQKQLGIIEESIAANDEEANRLTKQLQDSIGEGRYQWVPAETVLTVQEELRAKKAAQEEYTRVCTTLLRGIAFEIAEGGSGSEAVLQGLRQSLLDHGFGGGPHGPSLAVELLSTLMPPSEFQA